jgi:hypothetical protein
VNAVSEIESRAGSRAAGDHVVYDLHAGRVINKDSLAVAELGPTAGSRSNTAE